MSETAEAKFRFVIRNQDPDATEADVRKRLREATEEAIKEAKAKPSCISTELEGGFFGLGETAVILAVLHAAKAGAAAAALGTASAAGKDFYDGFLKKQLRKFNLLPSKFKEIGAKGTTGTAAKSTKKRPAKKPATKKARKEPASKKAPKKRFGK